MSKFTSEKTIEYSLIDQLTMGESQWTYRGDLTSEDALWANFKQILEQNNQSALKGIALTEAEFKQVQTQLQFPTFFDAAKWLSGENGVARVTVRRDDVTLSPEPIRLMVINNNNIAGGSSVYEVVNQYTSDKKETHDRKRIFDVTLLINGLPMIHIELKNRSNPYIEAFRQIQKYVKEGKFSGIYSTLQMFVVSNASQTRYIAAGQFDKLNDRFLSRWVDKNNNPVEEYIDFARKVLSIPEAHLMVSQYSVMDRDRKALILLRPYQIHAIEAVKEASRRQESGFVWHTTGSGKTLTSYKVAGNLLQIPKLDKTIFIVDRVDLDQQTTSSFTAYAEYDPISIDETDNVSDLMRKLAGDDRTVIITTIQKLNHLMRRLSQLEEADISATERRRLEKIQEKAVAFVVDECHRAVTPAKKRELDGFFKNAYWYGFTGTPIFEINARAELGNLARTTKDQYGRCLHQYTVKEAINDKAVLGFQVEYIHTISEETLDEIIEHENPGKEARLLSPIEKERLLPRSYYESEAHRIQVVDFIINKSRRKLNMKAGYAYGAMLTVPSISIAQAYYDLFQSIIAGNGPIQVSEKTKRLLPDFPKVAITYSISENEEASIHNQTKMTEALIDYNELYGTSYSLDQLRAYNQNINARLARKAQKYQIRAEQIDIIIVVDRLLTGFDAPCISTLFIDRPPMRPHDLIQAFSRTNRLFDAEKPYGQIVTFQMPHLFEEAVNEALILYSCGGEESVLAPTWDEAAEALIAAVEAVRMIAELPADLDQLDIKEKRDFVRAFQKLDKAISAIRVYANFKPEMLAETFGLDMPEFEEYYGRYVNILEELKAEAPDTEEIDPLDIEYELLTHRTEEINYQYIVALIQAFVPADQAQSAIPLIDEAKYQEVDEYIETLKSENPALGKIMLNLWDEIKTNPEDYRGQKIPTLLNRKIHETIQAITEAFAEKWALKQDDFDFLVANFDPSKEDQIGESELRATSDFEAYKANTENPVNRLRYWRTVKEDYTEMIVERVLPLRG